MNRTDMIDYITIYENLTPEELAPLHDDEIINWFEMIFDYQQGQAPPPPEIPDDDPLGHIETHAVSILNIEITKGN